MLGVSGQITTGALTRRTAGGGAGCRNLHRGMRLASGGGLLDVLRLRGLPVMGWSQWQQCYDSLTAIIYISLSPCPHFQWGWSQRLCSYDLTTAYISLSLSTTEDGAPAHL